MRNSSDHLWVRASKSYRELTQGHKADSLFLRERHLYPTLIRFIESSGGTDLLDLGSGDGSIWQFLPNYNVFSCDIVQESVALCEKPSVQDANRLAFRESTFNLVLASLLLMWISDISTVLSEIRRVLRVGGHAIVSLVHPYFYRTGEVDPTGNFVITRDLSQPWVLRDLHIADSAGPFTYYYRPPHQYMNQIIHAGLSVEEIFNSFIAMDEYDAIVPAQRRILRRTGKIPIYSFILCRKTAE